MIAWNNTELMADAKERLRKYESKVYDDNSIAEAKADRATLNNVSKALNTARLDVKKQYEEPYLQFKSQVDEVIAHIDKVASTIAVQINEYEETRKVAKEAEIIGYFDNKIGDLAQFVKYEQIYNPKWLNVTVSAKVISAEIDAKIEQIRNELLTIAALKSDDEETLKAFYFRTLNLAAALTENEHLKAEKQRIADAKAKAQAIAIATKEVNTPPVEEPDPQEQTYTVKFEVNGTQSQIQALKEFLIKQQIDYKSI